MERRISMKLKLLALIAIWLIGSIVSLGTEGAVNAESEASGMLLPKEIFLNAEVTPIYAEIDGELLYEVGPQVVKVTGAEEGWVKKLLNENDGTWFQIATSNGDRWVHLQSPEFEESYYQYVVLGGNEHLYARQAAGATSLGMITPQVVKSIYSDNGYYRIESWLGYKWIKPAHQVYEGVSYNGKNHIVTNVQLRSNTPTFLIPDQSSEAVGLLAPQSVPAMMSLDSSWYYINTLEGKRWIHKDVHYPLDLHSEETTVTITAPVTVYEHPDKGARELGILGPQAVQTFERGEGWHHIHSEWLGDAWIYQIDPAADPNKYLYPKSIIPQSIPWDMKVFQSVIGNRWNSTPIDANVVVSHGERIAPEAFFPFGQPATIRFSFKNISQDEIILADSTFFEIAINRINPSDGKKLGMVWLGKIAMPSGLLKSAAAGGVNFEWDQKDTDGKQVPNGSYRVEIKLPMTINYTKNGIDEVYQEQVNGGILGSFPLLISAP
jgi:hypothetical protein